MYFYPETKLFDYPKFNQNFLNGMRFTEKNSSKPEQGVELKFQHLSHADVMQEIKDRIGNRTKSQAKTDSRSQKGIEFSF